MPDRKEFIYFASQIVSFLILPVNIPFKICFYLITLYNAMLEDQIFNKIIWILHVHRD